MPDQDKPFFSRPMLSVISVLCIVFIWTLNQTGSNSNLPTPTIETWQTTSGIPVVWLNQETWQQGDKLDIRFSFQESNSRSALKHATFTMLMRDSLPLSTSSINQRLEPLAASVSSYYNHEQQSIGLTVSNQPQYLTPTLSLITGWLTNPQFKSRTFINWQQQNSNLPDHQHTLENQLFHNNETPPALVITLENIQKYYSSLNQHAMAIYVMGNLPDSSKSILQNALNDITENYKVPEENNASNLISATHSPQILEQNKTATNQLWQSRSAVALTPLSSIKEWLSLQLWGADLVSSFNQQTHMDFAQLALTLAPKQPWAWWNIQYASDLSQDGNTSSTPTLSSESFIKTEQIPSFSNKEHFKVLLKSLQEQLEHQALSPTWWAYIATQVTHPQSGLTLQDFANGYKEAVDSFTQEDYQHALSRLLQPASYQEIQVYQ